jgi:alpha-L-rhamnosidase
VKHIWFRKNLTLEEPIKSAFIHIASVGYHELYVNGKKFDDSLLAPAATRLDKRVLYMTYDVSGLLKTGGNTIALWQGPGWGRYAFFKTLPALRVQLDATTATGKSISLASDTTWRCEVSSSENVGDTKFKDNGGERIDSRGFFTDWNAVGFDDSKWQLAAEAPINAELSAQMMEPTRIIETIPALSVSGDDLAYKVDMGKNFTGWMEIKLKGLSAGDVVTVKVADDDKTVQDFGQKNEFVSSGKDGEIFRNRFNYISGRYLTIEGLKSKPDPADITCYALSTNVKRTGKFSSSSDLFNQIYEADLWTWRANLVEGFTMDCPHRERLGYGEVAFACAWGIAFPNYQTGALYTKHVRDWSDVQEDNGWIHHTAPQINRHYGGPMWSSAGQNVARAFYQNFGDQRMLELAHPSGKRWLEFLHTKVKDGLLRSYDKHWGKFLGDWAAPEQRKERGDSPEAEFFNNCVYAMNLADFIESSRILNKPEDVALYSGRLDDLRKQVHAAYFKPAENTYCNGTQVQLAFALLTGITPPSLRPAVAASLDKELTVKSHLDMGSSGLPVLLKYLIESSDRSAPLYQHLSSTTEPSYGYFIKRGESTWPEYWNVDVPSRIHTCYTGISSWFTKTVAGIRPDPEHPGFQSFIINPLPGGDLTYAEASMESPHGTISSRWERKGDTLLLKVTVPANSQATVYVPTIDAPGLTEGGKPVSEAPGITLLRTEGAHAVLKVAAGSYEFRSRMN